MSGAGGWGLGGWGEKLGDFESVRKTTGMETGITKIRGCRVGGQGAPGLKWGHKEMAGVELRQQFQGSPTGIKCVRLDDGPQQRSVIRALEQQLRRLEGTGAP